MISFKFRFSFTVSVLNLMCTFVSVSIFINTLIIYVVYTYKEVKEVFNEIFIKIFLI